MWSTLNGFLLQQVYPNLYAFHAKRKIQRKIAEMESNESRFSVGPELDLDSFLDELKDYAKREDDRKKVIDDKAKSSLLIITISSTLMLTGLTLIKEGKIHFRLPLLVIIFLGITYFVLSAITSVVALSPLAFYGSHPDEWIKEVNGKQTLTELKKLDRIHRLYYDIKLNEYVLNIRNNFVSATLIGIRNGVLLLSLAFGIALSNIGNQVKYLDTLTD